MLCQLNDVIRCLKRSHRKTANSADKTVGLRVVLHPSEVNNTRKWRNFTIGSPYLLTWRKGRSPSSHSLSSDSMRHWVTMLQEYASIDYMYVEGGSDDFFAVMVSYHNTHSPLCWVAFYQSRRSAAYCMCYSSFTLISLGYLSTKMNKSSLSSPKQETLIRCC